MAEEFYLKRMRRRLVQKQKRLPVQDAEAFWLVHDAGNHFENV